SFATLCYVIYRLRRIVECSKFRLSSLRHSNVRLFDCSEVPAEPVKSFWGGEIFCYLLFLTLPHPSPEFRQIAVLQNSGEDYAVNVVVVIAKELDRIDSIVHGKHKVKERLEVLSA
ncbi:MAG: hypothetical protein WCP55_10885, partial [Lentisphaerota bacterium]